MSVALDVNSDDQVGFQGKGLRTPAKSTKNLNWSIMLAA